MAQARDGCSSLNRGQVSQSVSYIIHGCSGNSLGWVLSSHKGMLGQETLEVLRTQVVAPAFDFASLSAGR